MIEGQGSKTFSKAKAFLYKHPIAAHKLLEKLTETIIAYLKLKVASGADVLQVFDSWAGMLNKELYDALIEAKVSDQKATAAAQADITLNANKFHAN